MTSPNSPLACSLSTFVEKFIENNQQQLPKVEFDPDWLSPCQVGEPIADGICWHPVKCQDKLNFNNVEEALELTLHQDFKDYFTAFYSESIPAYCQEGKLELLFAWNKDDFARLQENIIGHVLMKKRLKQEITLFFAVTDQEDFIISINNNNGEVWVEQVGCKPHKKLADSLAEFIEALECKALT